MFSAIGTFYHCSLTASVISFSLCISLFLLFQSMALATNPTSINSINHKHAPSRSCWTGLCGEQCCLGLGDVLWGISSLLQHLWSPGGWQSAGSPVAQWSSRPSMTITIEGLMDGRSALGRANGLFSWKRPTMTGGRWEKSSSFFVLSLCTQRF